MEQSSLERTIHRIPASRSNVASNKTRLHGRQRVAAYCRVSTDSEEQINSYTAQKAYYTQKIEESPDWELAGILRGRGDHRDQYEEAKRIQPDDHRLQAGRDRPHPSQSLSPVSPGTP